MAQNLRRQGSNAALQQRLANESGQSLNVISTAVNDRSQRPTSNLGGSGDLTETNQRLSDIAGQLTDLNRVTQSNNETLTTISESSTSTTGTGTTAAAAVSVPDINVNIQGQQQVTVTGFESGVQTIVTGLTQTFGEFVTDTEARNIANEVVEAIRLQLERLGIIQRNQL